MPGTSAQENDPYVVGFQIGQQRGFEASRQMAMLAAQASAQAEARQPVIINNKAERFPFVRGFLGLMFAGTITFVTIDGITQEESVNEGSASSIVDARSRRSIVVWSGQKIVSGDADHDVLGPSANPRSYSVGIVERQVEYIPQGALQVAAIDDPDLGFFLLLTENKDGEDVTPDFSNITLTTPKPEPCPIKIVDNEIRPKDYCTPLTDPASTGLLSTEAWQGGPYQNDNRITEDGRRALNVAIDNTFCELGLVFGTTSVANAMEGDGTSMTQARIYQGIEEAVKANIRKDLSLQYGIPLTNEIGRPLVLWPDDVTLLRAIVAENGKPLTSFTTDEYRAAVRLESVLNSQQEGKIDPGPTYASEILDLRDKYKDVNTPKQDPPLTRENVMYSAWNFSCLPKPGTPEAEEMVRQEWIRRRAGGLTESPAYAKAEGDGSHYDEQEASAMIAAFRERVGV